MDLKLKVLSGATVGREINIPVNKFIIGRGEECQLRPKSDLISRQHCAFVISGGKVIVVDGSKNGTFINEERITGKREVHSGDKLRIGELQFEILIGTTLAAAKKPKVVDVKDAAIRTVQANNSQSDMDVMSWLEEDAALNDTRRLYMADTAQINQAAGELAEQAAADATVADNSANRLAKKKQTKEYGKLPTPPAPPAPKDSRQAAHETLKSLGLIRKPQ